MAVLVLWGISSNLTSVLSVCLWQFVLYVVQDCGWNSRVHFSSIASVLWNGLFNRLKLLSRMCRSLVHTKVPSRVVTY